MPINVTYVPSIHTIKVKTWWDLFMEADFAHVVHPERTVAFKLYEAQQEQKGKKR